MQNESILTLDRVPGLEFLVFLLAFVGILAVAALGFYFIRTMTRGEEAEIKGVLRFGRLVAGLTRSPIFTVSETEKRERVRREVEADREEGLSPTRARSKEGSNA